MLKVLAQLSSSAPKSLYLRGGAFNLARYAQAYPPILGITHGTVVVLFLSK